MKKLIAVQADIGKIKKNLVNPFLKNKYVDINGLLDQILPILNQHGVALFQPLSNVGGRPAITTMLVDSETGEAILESAVTIPDLDDSQKMGGAITYFRRYSLISFFALEAEDDDGNTASAKSKKVGEPDLPF
jgi:hypothetical protein